MKKQTLIIIVLCVLLAAVIALSALGVIGPQDSSTGYTGDVPTVTPNDTKYNPYGGWDQSDPTTP